MAAELSGIEGLLASRIGLDPVSVGSPLIVRAVRQRMRELGLDDLGAYERRLRQSEPELQALIEEVVVSESWFFRDERPFQWFREYVRARWLDDPATSAAPGPELAVRRRRRAILDRHDALRPGASGPPVSHRCRRRQRPPAGDCPPWGLLVQCLPRLRP